MGPAVHLLQCSIAGQVWRTCDLPCSSALHSPCIFEVRPKSLCVHGQAWIHEYRYLYPKTPQIEIGQ